jgi:hypothetical protein
MAVAIGCLFCVLFAGLRSESDNDWETYLSLFADIPPITDGFGRFVDAATEIYLEPGFSFCISLAKVLLSDKFLFLPISAVSVAIYYFTFKRYAAYPALAFAAYIADGFYLREFTQVRFGLAVAIGMVGWVALINRRPKVHVFLSLLATLFHFTAIFLLITSFWLHFAKTRKRLLWGCTLLLLLALAGVFNGLVEGLASVGLAPARLTLYIGTNESANVSILFILLQYFLLVVSVFSIEDKDRDFPIVSVLALSFVFTCLFSGFDLMRRVSFLFSPALYFIASIAARQRKWFLLFVIFTLSTATLVFRFAILGEYKMIDL